MVNLFYNSLLFVMFLFLFASSLKVGKIRKQIPGNGVPGDDKDGVNYGIGFDTYPNRIYVYKEYLLVIELTAGNDPSSKLKVERKKENSAAQRFKTFYREEGEDLDYMLIFTNDSRKFALVPKKDGTIGVGNYEEAKKKNDTSNFFWEIENKRDNFIDRVRFVHFKTGKCMSVLNGLNPGNTVGLQECSKGSWTPNQIFTDTNDSYDDYERQQGYIGKPPTEELSLGPDQDYYDRLLLEAQAQDPEY